MQNILLLGDLFANWCDARHVVESFAPLVKRLAAKRMGNDELREFNMYVKLRNAKSDYFGVRKVNDIKRTCNTNTLKTPLLT